MQSAEVLRWKISRTESGGQSSRVVSWPRFKSVDFSAVTFLLTDGTELAKLKNRVLQLTSVYILEEQEESTSVLSRGLIVLGVIRPTASPETAAGLSWGLFVQFYCTSLRNIGYIYGVSALNFWEIGLYINNCT